MIDITTLTIETAHKDLTNGTYTVRELVQAYLDEIKKRDGDIHAYLEVYDDVLTEADRAQAMFADKTATLLTGIPCALKDNILVEGKHASAGSKILENYTSVYDATVVKALKKAGAIILGRTNMDEFAMGSSTQTSAYGVTRNPYDLSRVPGGSSGGSAAALAGNLALMTLGTETCGSVRQPASFCGLVGFKPTYGALSRHGIIAMGNSLDQVSPFGKKVADVEIVHTLLSQYDPEDATSVPEKFRTPQGKMGGKKIGVPRSFLTGEGIDPRTLLNFEQSLEKLKHAGYEVVDIDVPVLKYSLAAYYVIMPAEVSTNLSRFDGIRYGFSAEGKNLMEVYTKSRGQGFGKEARRRILLGTYVLSHGYYDAYYMKALEVREQISRALRDAFKEVDLIATPTTPSPAFKIGEKMDDPVAMYLCDVFAAPANLAGIPALALPSGTTEDGLPLSIQFMAPHFSEQALFEVGKKFETIR
jgi:aspartyl-tRNA(Asn)/glutamyl-tRNA(Gln) amidotransferase subunit A